MAVGEVMSDELPAALSELRIGALVLAEPLRDRPTPSDSITSRQQRLLQAILRAGRSEPCVAWDRTLSLQCAISRQRENEQWSDVGELSTKSSFGVHAAVALQDLLDEHMDGWRNTFG